jgi:hypothetical protein
MGVVSVVSQYMVYYCVYYCDTCYIHLPVCILRLALLLHMYHNNRHTYTIYTH